MVLRLVATSFMVFCCFASTANAAGRHDAAPPSALPGSQSSYTPSKESLQLEREKFEYNRQIEEEKLAFNRQLEAQKLEVEKTKAQYSALAIFVPLALGFATLFWQTRTANQSREREAEDLFELKAAEILFECDTTRAIKGRLIALKQIFPERFDQKFGTAFDRIEVGSVKYDPLLEVFKAACAKVSSPEEVYKVWADMYPADKWLERVIPGYVVPDANRQSATGKPPAS
ncbi:hypothetical protein LMG24235_04550 [Paraburkholderia sabiae]|nr:hypothetical protein LMG24235_04550 [Paraburkholderia sabiae]